MRPLPRAFAAFLALAAVFPLLPAAVPDAAGESLPLLSADDPDWRVTDPPRTFGPENLYEEIDGEAELFLPYAFREMTTAPVARKAGGGPAYRVERFRHGDAREAFGVYSQHRFPDQDVVRIGSSEAIVSDASIDVFKGEHFVRIRAGAGGSRGDLAALGRAVLSVLPGSGDPPPETRAFRIPGLVPGTTVYQKRAILGEERLSPGFEAKYEAEGLRGTLVLILPSAARDSGALGRLSGLPGWTRDGDGLYRADLPRRAAWFLPSGGHVLAVAGELPRAAALGILRRMKEAFGADR